MKAIKRPIAIEVITLEELLKQEREDIEIRKEDGSFQIFNRLHKSWIKLELEDYVNITDLFDTYPISKKVFDETYQTV